MTGGATIHPDLFDCVFSSHATLRGELGEALAGTSIPGNRYSSHAEGWRASEHRRIRGIVAKLPPRQEAFNPCAHVHSYNCRAKASYRSITSTLSEPIYLDARGFSKHATERSDRRFAPCLLIRRPQRLAMLFRHAPFLSWRHTPITAPKPSILKWDISLSQPQPLGILSFPFKQLPPRRRPQLRLYPWTLDAFSYGFRGFKLRPPPWWRCFWWQLLDMQLCRLYVRDAMAVLWYLR
jgi:hypothetical protein